jgi:ABC-type glutathione transport system ATPase component
VALEVEDAALAGPLQRVFGAFSAPGDVASDEARLVMRNPPSPVSPPTVQELPRLEPGDAGTLRVEGAGYSAVLSPDRRRADVVGSGRYPVENVIKIMLASALAKRGGLLVHGVGLVQEGRAALFVGHSGAGKSTLGGLWRDAGGTVLADELVAVWPGEDGMWRAAGTPWNVPVRTPEASLAAVGTLGWDAASRWETQGAGEVARVLLLNALLPEPTPSGRGALVGAAGRVLSSVETARLVFARDASAAAVVRARLA